MTTQKITKNITTTFIEDLPKAIFYKSSGEFDVIHHSALQAVSKGDLSDCEEEFQDLLFGESCIDHESWEDESFVGECCYTCGRPLIKIDRIPTRYSIVLCDKKVSLEKKNEMVMEAYEKTRDHKGAYLKLGKGIVSRNKQTFTQITN